VLRGQGDKNPWKDRKTSQPSKLKKHITLVADRLHKGLRPAIES
jgi:hypothetical protein